MLNYKIYLKDILKAIQRIDDSTKEIAKEQIYKENDVWDATLMRLQIIGESIKKVPLEIKRKYPNIEWQKLEKIRDIISHTYFKVNQDIIWDIIKNKLPSLKREIKKIIYSRK